MNGSSQRRVICRFTGYNHTPVQISVKQLKQLNSKTANTAKTVKSTAKPQAPSSAKTLKPQQYIYKVQLRNAPNHITSITARSYIDAARKAAKKLGCIFNDFVQTTTDDWSFHVIKYNTADTSIPVGDKYFRAKTPQDN